MPRAVTYCGIDDLLALLDAERRVNALDDNHDGQPDDDVAEAIIDMACNNIDALLSTRISVPADPNVFQFLKPMAAYFACDLCYTHRGSSSDLNPNKEWVAFYRKMLRDIVGGVIQLSAQASGSAPAVPDAVEFVVEEAKTFSGRRMAT